MSHDQSEDQERLNIALITEGTYPFHFGGVSTWCHLLIGDLSHIDFTLIMRICNFLCRPMSSISAQFRYGAFARQQRTDGGLA
jgi:hypothetical protein